MSAFTVHRTAQMFGATKGRIITYTSSSINHGNDMNYGRGIFTCRIPGLYFFMYSMKTDYSERPVTVHLKKNGIAANGLHSGWNAHIVTLSQSMILDLETRDAVWLEIVGSDSHIGGSQVKINTFTGFLIHPKI